MKKRARRLAVIASATVVVIGMVAIIATKYTQSPSCPETAMPANNRAHLVLLNALSVAHPDYQVNYLDVEVEKSAAERCRTSIDVPIEARSPYSVTNGKGWEVAISTTADGKSLDVPKLRNWTFGILSKGIGHPLPQMARKTSETYSVLEEIGSNVDAQIIVSLKSPMSESGATKMLPDSLEGFDLVFLSPGSATTKPVTWDMTPCRYRSIPGCATNLSLVGSFRHWVSLLKNDDAESLRQFGLSLRSLRTRATEGGIYGFVVSGKADEVAPLLRLPVVEWARVTNLQMPPYLSTF